MDKVLIEFRINGLAYAQDVDDLASRVGTIFEDLLSEIEELNKRIDEMERTKSMENEKPVPLTAGVRPEGMSKSPEQFTNPGPLPPFKPRMTQEEYLDRFFKYHAPKGDQAARYQKINDACRIAAEAIYDNAPESPERTLALRDLEMARMRANQSIAVNE